MMRRYERGNTSYRIVHHRGLSIPLEDRERFLAYDADGKLWAYEAAPRWSAASSKWIPQEHDTPRWIITYHSGHVNPIMSISMFDVD